MKNKKDIDVIENIIQAISILNGMDNYLESLPNELSYYDSINCDYIHFIENTPVEDVNLKKLYLDMQKNLQKRRCIKRNLAIKDNYNNVRGKLINESQREFIIPALKNAVERYNHEYVNRILTDKNIEDLKIKKRGRPKKVKGGV